MKKQIVIEDTCEDCSYNCKMLSSSPKFYAYCVNENRPKDKCSILIKFGIPTWCPLPNYKSWTDGFKKGRESVLRNNPSGCGCLFDEEDNLVSICNAHKQWVEDHK